MTVAWLPRSVASWGNDLWMVEAALPRMPAAARAGTRR